MTIPNSITYRLLALMVVISPIYGCGNGGHQEKHGQWLVGTDDEKFRETEKQFRGFDVAMFEMSYRYQELYWAGTDGNWEYADHQVEHMEVVLRNAMERRRKRSASAEEFIAHGLTPMGATIAKKDSAGFGAAFLTMTSACNKCHAREDHGFVNVKPPTLRTSLVTR